MYEVNFVAVLVASLAAFIIGFLAHGPVAGKLWMKLAGVVPTGNEKFSNMYGQMAMNFLMNIVTACTIAILINIVLASSVFDKTLLCAGLTSAFIGWLGFIVPSSSMGPIWMKQSWKLWIFECISTLVSLLAMGAIIASW